jgi:hypothetical protein
MNKPLVAMRTEECIHLLYLRPENEARQLAELIEQAQQLPASKPIPYVSQEATALDFFGQQYQTDFQQSQKNWNSTRETIRKRLSTTYKSLLKKLMQQGLGSKEATFAHQLASVLAGFGLTGPIRALKTELEEIRAAEAEALQVYREKGLRGLERISFPDISSPYYNPIRPPKRRGRHRQHDSR